MTATATILQFPPQGEPDTWADPRYEARVDGMLAEIAEDALLLVAGFVPGFLIGAAIAAITLS